MAQRTFDEGDRVVILKNPPGGYPEGFVPPLFTGRVKGLLADLDGAQALFQAVLAEYPDRQLDDLPWVSVTGPGSAPGAVKFEGDIPADIAGRLLADHPFYVVGMDGPEGGFSLFRPDELEPAP